MKVIKNSGDSQEFCVDKIVRAVNLANNSVPAEDRMDDANVQKVVNTVVKKLDGFTTVSVETIHEFVEDALMKHNKYAIARAYIIYRDEKKKNKKFNDIEEKALSLTRGTSDLRGDNANKHIDDNSSMRDYLAGIVCKSVANKTLPKDIINAHNKGLIHWHDMDYSPLQPLHNCGLVNIDDMFTNGFQMGDTKIEPDGGTPFETACNLLAQVNLIVSGRQYGGQTVSWSHLLPFIQNSRNNIRRDIINDSYDTFYGKCVKLVNKALKTSLLPISEKSLAKKTEEKLRKEVYRGVKTYQYQVLCHSSSNGQTPFVSNNLCLREARTQQELDDFAMLIEEIFKRRIKGVKDSEGHYISPLFPKLLYWTCDGLNVNPGDPYYYLTELAAECEVKRMQPDIVSEKETRRVKEGQIIPSMGCRSLLGPIWEENTYPVDTKFYWYEGAGTYPYGTFVEESSMECLANGEYPTGYEDGQIAINFRGNTGWLKKKTDTTVTIIEPKVYGRWNNGVITINLPHAALSARQIAMEKGNGTASVDELKETFYKVLDERLELCRKALVERYKSCQRIKAKNSEILWMHGALARLNPDETVNDLMTAHPKRASISLGYSGLYEVCRAIIGESNTSENGRKFAKEVLEHMNERCAQWKLVGSTTGSETITDNNGDELWNECKGNSTIIGNKMYPSSAIHVNGKMVHYIEKTGDKYSVHLVNENELVHPNFSIYGTPSEALTMKFALANRRDFGVVEYITDKDYVVNSYHVDPRENIDAFSKLKIEGEYLALSSGGAVSYIEMPDLSNNKKAILNIIKFMHENIVYSEFNRKIGTCYVCGHEGDMKLVKSADGDFKFICPVCGNSDDSRMSVTARICGYLGKVNAGNTNKGRLDDIYNRVIHLDNFDEVETIKTDTDESEQH